MAVRATMANLILSVRTLINDTLLSGNGQIFTDQQIQDVMDESREDVKNEPLIPKPTFNLGTIQYLDYWTEYGGWEDGMVLKQYLTVVVTPSLIEPIPGHFQFAANTWPPVYISGSWHDRYRAAADLLERLAAQYVLRYSMTVDGQNLQIGQVTTNLQNLAKTYRRKQRPRTIILKTAVSGNQDTGISLEPTALDYMSSGS